MPRRRRLRALIERWAKKELAKSAKGKAIAANQKAFRAFVDGLDTPSVHKRFALREGGVIDRIVDYFLNNPGEFKKFVEWIFNMFLSLGSGG